MLKVLRVSSALIWASVFGFASDASATVPLNRFDECGKFVLRTDKSYVAFDVSSYRMSFAKIVCSGNTVLPQAVPGRLTFEYRYIKNPTGTGYQEILDRNTNMPLLPKWSLGSSFVITPTTTSYWKVDVRKADVQKQFGTDLQSIALLFRARPEQEPNNWSRWIQVNYNTSAGLWDTKPMWDFSRGDAVMEGVNYTLQEKTRLQNPRYQSKIGRRSKDGVSPTMVAGEDNMNTRASALARAAEGVHIYTKTNTYGYHDSPWPWFNRDGNNNIIFWYRTNATMPEGHPNEQYVVMDYAEYRQPDYASWTNLDLVKSKPRSERRLHMDNASTSQYFRDYVFSPRYVGEGWGFLTNYKNPVTNNIGTWAVHADMLRDRDLGGSTDWPVLQLKYYETTVDSQPFTNPNQGLHREDWFFDANGVRRIEGHVMTNATPVREFLCSTRQYCLVNQAVHPYPPYYSKDGLANQIIKLPNYCLHRSGTPACSFIR
jgi:hypothetical protein